MTTDPPAPNPAALLAFTVPDDAAMAGLHRRLAESADRAGILDVAYRTIDSPVGSLLLAATERGLVRVAFASQGHDGVLESLASTLGPRILRAPGRLDPVAAELEEYFAGRRTGFQLPLDFSLSSGFRQLVQRHLSDIDYGHTATYQQLAQLVGNPGAVRAVGSACATNPLPIVVPCHRVIRTDGSIGGYAGGAAAKTSLLALEAA
jgi:methylated-DNA-[protein]-cysteine S-methyltransferase